MSNTLVLELAEPVYKQLTKKAKKRGQTPEQFVLAWVENITQEVQDPLLQLAGVFEAEMADISARHDEYIGAQLQLSHG
jgi:hypothetical protein